MKYTYYQLYTAFKAMLQTLRDLLTFCLSRCIHFFVTNMLTNTGNMRYVTPFVLYLHVNLLVKIGMVF